MYWIRDILQNSKKNDILLYSLICVESKNMTKSSTHLHFHKCDVEYCEEPKMVKVISEGSVWSAIV